MKKLRTFAALSVLLSFAFFPLLFTDSAYAACLNTAQTAAIAAAAAPTPAGETPTVTTIETCGGDDVSYRVPVTTTITFDGQQFNSVYATTNSVITFGRPDNTYWTYPNTPSISLYSMDWFVYPQAHPDEHLIINSSDGGFQVNISARPCCDGRPVTNVANPTNIIITAAINTDGTVAIAYAVSGPTYEGQTRTGVRLNNGSIVTLEQYGVVQVETAPTLAPDAGGTVISPEPTSSPTASPSPSASPTASPSVSPSVEPTNSPTPTPSPSPTQTPQPSPSPTPSPSPSISPSPTPSLVPTNEVTAPPSPTPILEPSPQETSSPTPTPVAPEPTPPSNPNPNPVGPQPSREPDPVVVPDVPNPPQPEPEPSQEEQSTPDTNPETPTEPADDAGLDSTNDSTDTSSTDPSEEPSPTEQDSEQSDNSQTDETSDPSSNNNEEQPEQTTTDTTPNNQSEEPSSNNTPDKVISDALADGKLTAEEKAAVVDALVSALAPGEAVSASDLKSAGLTYSDLPPQTPVDVRTDENGNPVIIEAEVAAALVLLDDPAQLIGAIFDDPGQVLTALGSIGADMSPAEREEATKMVVATVVATGAALNAVGLSTGGSAPTGGGSSGGSSSGESKAVRRRHENN